MSKEVEDQVIEEFRQTIFNPNTGGPVSGVAVKAQVPFNGQGKVLQIQTQLLEGAFKTIESKGSKRQSSK